MHSGLPAALQTIDARVARSVSLSPKLRKYDTLSPKDGEFAVPPSIGKLRYKHEYLEQLEQIGNAQTLHLRPNGQSVNVQRLQATLMDGLRQANAQTIQEGNSHQDSSRLASGLQRPGYLPLIRESNIGFTVPHEHLMMAMTREERLLHQLKNNLEIRMNQKQIEETKRSHQSFSGLDKKIVKEIVEHRQQVKRAKRPRRYSPKSPPLIEVYPRDCP